MDSSYNEIDTFRVIGDYITDFYDFIIAEDNTALMIGLINRDVDMSQIVDSGSTNAVVLDYAIQELDNDHQIVFEWRARDHFNITDAYLEDLSLDYIDYVHINSVAVDFDGHLLISSRKLNECTKINCNTGEIIWRLGGVNNQFQFINEDTDFIYQHDFQPVPGKHGNYTIFDNGYSGRPLSRVIEYKIDTTEMTAEKVWEYRQVPDYYAPSMGNAQRLPNGKTIINWNDYDNPKAMEVSPEGEIVYLGDFAARMRVYRTFRFDWNGVADKPYLILEQSDNNVRLIFNTLGRNDIDYYNIYGNVDENSASIIATSEQPWYHISIDELPLFNKYYIKVTSVDNQGVESNYSNKKIIFGTSDENLIINGEFTLGSLNWNLEFYNSASAQAETGQGFYHAAITYGGSSQSDIIISQNNIRLIENKVYTLELDSWANSDKFIDIKFYNPLTPWIDYGKIGAAYISTSPERLAYTFELIENSDEDVTLVFNIRGDDSDIYFDNIILTEQSLTNSEDDIENIPRFYLSDNYPNPFNSSTTIKYRIPSLGTAHASSLRLVTLKIFNILGRQVATIVNNHQMPGEYEIKFDGSSLSSGVYFYKLSVGEFVETKKNVAPALI